MVIYGVRRISASEWAISPLGVRIHPVPSKRTAIHRLALGHPLLPLWWAVQNFLFNEIIMTVPTVRNKNHLGSSTATNFDDRLTSTPIQTNQVRTRASSSVASASRSIFPSLTQSFVMAKVKKRKRTSDSLASCQVYKITRRFLHGGAIFCLERFWQGRT